MTLLLVVVILLNIPLIREITVFAYLSFVPGFVILKAFKLKELSLLSTFLMSVGLSVAASMFIGLLVNELYLVLGFSQPLSIISLTAAISAFTLVVFLVGYTRNSLINSVSSDGIPKATRSNLSLTLVLIILPILGTFGALYINIPIMIILCLTIAVLSILSIASNKFIPSKYHPFLIFSISISILLLHLLISKYITGVDAHTEYYVFKVTQIRENWGPIDPATNSWMAIAYNSVLSITILPTVYSVLMNLPNEMLFKILYSFIYSLVPVVLYGISKNETGKFVGLLSALFFVFSSNAFFGEVMGENRQIVGEFFLMLSIFLWLDKTLPTKEKRLLLIIFGVSISISHYSLAIIYLIFVSLVGIVSHMKSKFDDVFNAPTVLTLFGITFAWYALSSGSIQTSILNLIIDTIQKTFQRLIDFQIWSGAPGNASVIYGVPQTFTAASWINLAVSGAVTILLAIGIPIIIFFSGRIGVSNKYKLITIYAAITLAVSLAFPMIAQTLNFTRFYAIVLLFLSPCFAVGALGLTSTLRKRNKNHQNKTNFLNRHGKTSTMLVAVLLVAYFLSQSGFINYVTRGAIHSSTFDYYRIKTSNDPQVGVGLYATYIQEQDAFSADWLSKYISDSSIVYADSNSKFIVLISRALIPFNLIHFLTNVTKPEQGSLVYLSGLNIEKGLIPAFPQLFNFSDVSSFLSKSNLIYSNGKSQIWRVAESG
jgi:uncharacterized membrane protein